MSDTSWEDNERDNLEVPPTDLRKMKN